MAEEHSAGFVVFRKYAGKRSYLLLLHRDGRWDFPKGNIERGETSSAAAIRELKEETGIKWPRIVRGFEKSVEYYYRKEGSTVRKDVVFYLAEAPDEKIVISDENNGSGWFGYEESMAKLRFENARNVLEKAEKFLGVNPAA